MTLYMPIGPPASGKSFLQAAMIEDGWLDPEAVVSTDDLRTKLTGFVGDQTANGQVFQIVDIMVRERLRRGLDVWHDATNLTVEWRKKAVAEAHRWNQPIVSILMTANDATCIVRNLKRTPPVPDDVMVYMCNLRREIRHQDLPGHVTTDTEFYQDRRWSISLHTR